jgi:1,4-dihydroxy-2-naphthoyl-CoA synthase
MCRRYSAQEAAAMGLVNKVVPDDQGWLGRIQLMAEVGSAFASKLIAARSPLDAFAAWQEGAAQWLKISAENWQRLFSDGQKIGELESRLVAAADAADE